MKSAIWWAVLWAALIASPVQADEKNCDLLSQIADRKEKIMITLCEWEKAEVTPECSSAQSDYIDALLDSAMCELDRLDENLNDFESEVWAATKIFN